jgi:addiction module HigA family antidote
MTLPIITIPVLTGEVAEEFLRLTEYNSKYLAGSEYSAEKEEWCCRIVENSRLINQTCRASKCCNLIDKMNQRIETLTIGEILNEEFFLPMGLSAYKVAQAINVPVSRIQDILRNRRRITIDTSLRLAKFFGVSDDYFLSLQNDIDIRNLKIELAEELDKIKAFVENKKR